MSAQATINSVLGPLTPDQIGFTLMHEHVMVAASGLYQAYPDLLGRGPEARAVESLHRAKEAGIRTIVDCTTFDLGRHAPLLRSVAKVILRKPFTSSSDFLTPGALIESCRTINPPRARRGAYNSTSFSVCG